VSFNFRVCAKLGHCPQFRSKSNWTIRLPGGGRPPLAVVFGDQNRRDGRPPPPSTVNGHVRAASRCRDSEEGGLAQHTHRTQPRGHRVCWPPRGLYACVVVRHGHGAEDRVGRGSGAWHQPLQ
jgi:hypothetical protein